MLQQNTVSVIRTARPTWMLLLALAACSGSSRIELQPATLTFATEVPLTPAEVDVLIQRAARAIDSPTMLVAVVDRVGRPLGIWARHAAPTEDQVNVAVSIARTGAMMSSSQGPITSRTLEAISTFHFPATFGPPTRNPVTSAGTLPPFNDLTLAASLPSQHVTTGVANTPQGPLWQIFSTNRGSPFAGIDLVAGPGQTAPPTNFAPPTGVFTNMRIPPAGRVDLAGDALPNQPGTGLSYLAGGIPIYKAGLGAANFAARLVGGIGVYVLDGAGQPLDQVAEFAAIRGLGGIDENGNKKGIANFGAPLATLANAEDLNLFFPYDLVPPIGLIYLNGVLLPYTQEPVRPAGVGLGTFDPAGTLRPSQPGGEQPEGWIIGPRDDPDFPDADGLTQLEVQAIIERGIAYANGTRAAIRVPNGSPTKMVFAVTNRRGLILGVFRMTDAPVFSYDVSVTKARCVTYLSSTESGNPALTAADAAILRAAGIEPGTAISTRTLGFLTQPFFPPGIDDSGIKPGPLFRLAAQNADPSQFNRMANAPPIPALQSGLVLFPGATPLYKRDGAGNAILVGGFGVSGDGVEQDDFVTSGGCEDVRVPGVARDFSPPQAIRADQRTFAGVRLPFFKFPQIPGPGGN